MHGQSTGILCSSLEYINKHPEKLIEDIKIYGSVKNLSSPRYLFKIFPQKEYPDKASQKVLAKNAFQARSIKRWVWDRHKNIFSSKNSQNLYFSHF